jgi:hypothetical protein
MLVCVVQLFYLVNSYDVGVCVVQLFHLVNSYDVGVCCATILFGEFL